MLREIVSRDKQTFDIGLRKFNAFINDWNDSKSVVMANQFRIGLGMFVITL